MQDETWLNIYSLIQVYQVFVKLEDIYLFTVELQNHLEGKYFKSLTGKLSTLQTSGNFTCYFQFHPQLCCVLCISVFARFISKERFYHFKTSHIVSREEILQVKKFYMINLIYILFYTTLFKKRHSQLSNWWHAPTRCLSLVDKIRVCLLLADTVSYLFYSPTSPGQLLQYTGHAQ